MIIVLTFCTVCGSLYPLAKNASLSCLLVEMVLKEILSTATSSATTLFFGDHRFTEGKITKTITATAALKSLFGNHAKSQADLFMAINGRPNAMLMPDLDCSPKDPVWTNFANFWQNLQQASVGLFGASF